MRELTTVSVRDLATFVHRRGDLFEPGGRVSAEEGIQGQAALQKRRGDSYQREVSFAETLPAGHWMLTLRGRADGVDLVEGLVEEIKASRRWPDIPFAEHRAQVLLYAALLARQHTSRETWRVRVTYVDPDSLETRSFDELASPQQLAVFLESTLSAWTQWISARLSVRQQRDAWLANRPFPLPDLRPWQGAMIRRTARAIEDREPLLLEAPTGSGKTLAVTWPAVRALPQASRVFYLTSRSTGARAALHALRLIDNGENQLSRIVLTAKEKICPVPGTPCNPEVCRYARGYYDRSRAAVEQLLEIREATADQVSTVAAAHEVCPFELSLDASLWYDVVIGDYNYIFDPVVRLQRFAGDAEAILLVDEAHQLAPRVCAALSSELSRALVRTAIADAPEPLARALRSIDRVLQKIGKGSPAGETTSRTVEVPDALARSLQTLGERVATWQREHPEPFGDNVQQALFAGWRWLRLSAWFDVCATVFLATGEGTELTLEARCLDASGYLQSLWKQSGAVVRFSATVSPPLIYQATHGLPIDTPGENFARAGSPFRPAQLCVLVVTDVDTRWRQREATLPSLVHLLDAVVTAKPGRYLLCFPSYHYLRQFELQLQASDAVDRVRFTAQQSGREAAQDPARDASLLDLFRAHDDLVLGIVLGGTLSESIDLIDTPLAGVIVVGVAQSPPSVELDRAAAHFDSRGLDGHLMAYIQPGMSKIVQAAGRLIRTETHRGVLLLVDGRFRQPAWRQFFPSLWEPRVTTARDVGQLVKEFWTLQ